MTTNLKILLSMIPEQYKKIFAEWLRRKRQNIPTEGYDYALILVKEEVFDELLEELK